MFVYYVWIEIIQRKGRAYYRANACSYIIREHCSYNKCLSSLFESWYLISILVQIIDQYIWHVCWFKLTKTRPVYEYVRQSGIMVHPAAFSRSTREIKNKHLHNLMYAWIMNKRLCCDDLLRRGMTHPYRIQIITYFWYLILYIFLIFFEWSLQKYKLWELPHPSNRW